MPINTNFGNFHTCQIMTLATKKTLWVVNKLLTMVDYQWITTTILSVLIWNTYKSVGYLILCVLSVCLLSSLAYAGGSIFGGHKHKTANPNGVYSIGVHICSSLECPPIRIVEGDCSGTNMTKHWGVCVCDKGYVAQGIRCVACPEGQFSDGISGCTSCPEGMYRANENDTTCTE